MEWYTVRKTIRGRSYVYRQRTCKVGTRVVTESKYVGPASSAAGNTTRGGARSGPRCRVETSLDALGRGQQVLARAAHRLGGQIEDLGLADAVPVVRVGVGLWPRVGRSLLNSTWTVTLPVAAVPQGRRVGERTAAAVYGGASVLCLRLARKHRPELYKAAKLCFSSHKAMRNTLAAAMRKGRRRTERAIDAELKKARTQRKATATRLRNMGWVKRLVSKRGRQARRKLAAWRHRERAALVHKAQLVALAPFLTRW